jgi:hypothetical protein
VPRTRPPYPEEFKREAIELVRLTDKSVDMTNAALLPVARSDTVGQDVGTEAVLLS